MNKIYRIIRHSGTGAMIVVSEITKTRHRSGRNRLMMSTVITAGLSFLSPATFAAVTEGYIDCTTVADSSNSTTNSADTSGAGANAVAVGYYACAPGTGSVAIGRGASAYGVRPDGSKSRQTVSIGEFAWAQGDQSIAIGANSQAFGASSIAIGGDDIDSAIAKEGTQANYLQLTNDTLTAGVYTSTQATGEASLAVGMQNMASGDFSNAIGIRSNASGFASLAMGVEALASNLGSVAVGVQANATGLASTAIGTKTKAQGDNSVAIGSDTGDAPYTEANGHGAVALGSSSVADSDNSVALGSNSRADVDKGIAGFDVAVSGSGQSANTSPIWQSTYAAISVGDANNNITRQITGVAAGFNDSDAVNVAQLKQVEAHADDLGTAIAGTFGAGASYNPDGNQWVAPSYTVTGADGNTVGQPANDVGTALANLNNYVNQGFKVGDNSHQAVGTVTPGGQINFVNGQNSVANVTTDANGTNVSFDVTPSSTGDASEALGNMANAFGAGASYNPDGNQWTAPAYTVMGADGNTVGQPANDIGTALTNLNSYVNQGFKVGDNGHQVVSTITPGNQINFVNGQNSVANVTMDANGTNVSFDLDPSSTGNESVALGNGAVASTEGGVALGSHAQAATPQGIAGFDVAVPGNGQSANTSPIWQSTYAAVSVGDPTNDVTRQITGVAAGFNDSDAVNVAQLKQVETHADDLGTAIASSIGGGASYNPDDNQWVAPSYTVTSANGNTVGQPANDVGTALANLNSYVNQGFIIGDNSHQPVSTITPGSQINFVDGQNSVAHVTTDDNGTNISFDFSGSNNNTANSSPVVYTTLDGKTLYQVNGEYFDNADGTGTPVDKDSIIASVKNANGSTAPTDPAVPLAHIGSSIQLATLDANTPYAALNQLNNAANNPNLVNNAVNVGDLRRTAGAITDNISTVLGTTVNPDGSINVPDLTIGDTHYSNFAEAINKLGEGWQLTTAAGTNTTIPSGNGQVTGSSAANVYPNDTVTMMAGQNIVLRQDDKNVTISVADDIQLNSVTTGQTRISNAGVHIGQGDKQVSLTEAGLDNGGNTITNVAPGVNGTDAVNVNQLNSALGNMGNMGNTNQRINRLNDRVDRLENHANAGIAQAMATASLPQAYIPGKSMMSMSGGFYRGETGYALGLSTISDSGNWVFKVSGSGNSRGNYGGTFGAGYQW